MDLARCAAVVVAGLGVSVCLGAERLPSAEPSHAEAQKKAAEVFDVLYGQDERRVRGTRKAADDVALAERLLTGTSDNHTGLSTATKYYCTIERASDTSIELRIYSDSGRSTLVDTLRVSVAAGRA
ncbi:MAG: hypothetical protein U9R68_03480 [Planctomycetota bacterium]|nr:hypothetical protein [Planctomycetota bacterium]